MVMASYQAGFLAVALNFAFWLFILIIQFAEFKAGLIKKRSKWGSAKPFLYFQDWNMALYGDLVGLSLVDFVFGLSISQMYSHWAIVDVSAVLAFVATVSYHRSRLFKGTRPDSGYPGRGKTSLHNYVHLVYFFAQYFICIAVIVFLLCGLLVAPVTLLALIGGAVYILTYLVDLQQGKLISI
jgi:hypothetical protein